MQRFSFILGLFLIPSFSFASISYPSSGFLSATSGTGSDMTATLSAILDPSVDKLIVSVIGREPITGCSYNGDTMTLIEASSIQYGYNYHSVYYLDDPDTNSAHNIICSYNSSTAYRGISYIGVSGSSSGLDNSVTPVNGVNDGSMITTNITNNYDNSHIIESVYTNNTSLTLIYGASQSQLVGIPDDDVWTSLDYRAVGSAGAYTVSVEPASGTPNQDVIVFSIPVLATSSPSWASSTPATDTDIAVGFSIIIMILSMIVTGMVWNSFSKK